MTQNRYPETTNPEQCILVIGNPVDGLRFVGRFDTPADASDYGDQAFGDQTWWVTPLECVQCDEEGNWVNPEIGDDPDDMPHGPRLHQLQGRQGPRIRPSDPGPGSVRKGSAMNIIRQCYDDWGNFHEPLHSPWFMFVMLLMLFIIGMGAVLLLTS